MTTHRAALAVSALAFNALVWGLSWWPLRQLDLNGLHPLWTTACVFTLATVVLTFISPSGWRALRQQPQLWWLMAASGLTNVGFNWAVTTGDVVRVVLLFYLMPTWSLLLAWWLLGERPTRMSILRLLLALAGVALVLKTPDTPWPIPSSATDYLALLGGASFALNNAMLRKLADLPETVRMGAMFSGGMAITAFAALALLPTGQVALPADMSWWPYALGLALCLLFSNLSLQYGAARLAASTTSLVMLSEILFATASSVALGVSELSERKMVGGLLIVFAAVLATMPSSPKEPP